MNEDLEKETVVCHWKIKDNCVSMRERSKFDASDRVGIIILIEMDSVVASYSEYAC